MGYRYTLLIQSAYKDSADVLWALVVDSFRENAVYAFTASDVVKAVERGELDESALQSIGETRPA
jgi:hypothetical protein